MALSTELKLKAVLDIIDNIKDVKKKKLDCNVILHEASAILGLNKNEIKDALQNLTEREILIVQDNCLTVDKKGKLQVTKNLLNLLSNAAPGIAHVSTSTVEMQTDCPTELGSPPLSQIHYPQPVFREKECDIYKSFSQLSNSVADLQNVLLSEREMSRKLQNEKTDLRLRLGLRNTDSSNNRPENLDGHSCIIVSPNKETPMTKPSTVYENIESDQTMQIKTQRETTKRKRRRKRPHKRMLIQVQSHQHLLGLKKSPAKVRNSQKTVMRMKSHQMIQQMI